MKMCQLYFDKVEPALDGTIALFKFSEFYKSRTKVFDALERATTTLKVEQDHDSGNESGLGSGVHATASSERSTTPGAVHPEGSVSNDSVRPEGSVVMLRSASFSKRVSAKNVAVYEAWHELTHPASALVAEAFDHCQSCTTKEDVIAGWESTFTQDRLFEAATKLEAAVKTIMDTV